MESSNHYLQRLYPLQDKFLSFFDRYHDGRFYLTGGTALSRIYVQQDGTSLKIDFVNEGVFHSGAWKSHSIFSCIDNEMNVLVNKLTCVYRYEAKDMADIWILAKKMPFSWREVLSVADKKSPMDPLEISKIIKKMPRDELEMIKWAFDANLDEIYSDLQAVADDILLGRVNSLEVIPKSFLDNCHPSESWDPVFLKRT